MNQPSASRPRICVSLAQPTVTALLAAGRAAAPEADLLEIRLDALTVPASSAVAELLAAGLGRPLLFTNRPTWEGGNFSGPEEERIAPLLAAIKSGAAYVDIEMRAAVHLRQQIIAAAKAGASQVIVSWHDFSGTPAAEELTAILRQQQASGGHLGKIVTTATAFPEVLRVLNLQSEAAELNFPLIAFCMGEAGMISRLATLYLGGRMTYAAPAAGQTTAPGQLPAATLREIERLLTP